jgi:protein-disulfide isomerase
MHLIPARGRILAALCLSGAALLLAQDWKTRSDVPGVDLTGLPPAKTNSALRLLRNHDCTCGCDMKVAQCRVEDPQCAYSKGLAAAIVEALKAGKSESDAVLAANASRWGTSPAPPKLLEAPVAIPVAGSPVTGAGDAPITLVEFSDFQCPYCYKAVRQLDAVLKAYPKQVKLIFKEFPLDMHSQAALAAQAAIAAHQQGKFWPMYEIMFANRSNLSRPAIMTLAGKVGLDLKRFTVDLDSEKTRMTVARDEADGDKAGVEGTPTVFINGQRYNGSLELEPMQKVIDTKLKELAKK